MKHTIKCGADRIDEYRHLFSGRKIGLITTPTGVLSDLTSSIDKFYADYDLRALFAPEHGVRGDQQDGAAINSYMDKKTGVPVFSIYGEKRTPVAEELADVDMLVYDIQDVGSRFYTFIYSMANSMSVAKEREIPFVVLDRPNPIGGLNPEGSPMSEGCTSFIGMYDIPQRYSLTVGELALLLNDREKIHSDLHVIPMIGWKRDYYLDDLEYSWINPSPNIASFDAILLYNGTCLFEATNLSEGRGTTRPFEMIGAPWLDADEFADRLNAQNIPGVIFRPTSFIPQFHKFKGELCHGVQIHLLNKRIVRPVELGLRMVRVAMDLSGENFRFTVPRHEVGEYTIDLMFGSPKARKSFDINQLLKIIDSYSAAYRELYKNYWLYQ
jgi:uncharacterized protein YbbC (DUF1343 family)